ncbi:somatostatin 1.2 [Paralichthys olivaceus]|uniref:somatostatin 1.2 n=1 Tax=Paralichthys olivaceus TaxID=8255 RepID=UPI003753A98D
MQCVRCPAFFILVGLVLCGPVFSQPDRDQDQYQNQDLDLELHHRRLLQKARSAGLLTQEWSKRAAQDLLSQDLLSQDLLSQDLLSQDLLAQDLLAQMSLPKADAQRDAEMVSTATGGRMNLERSIEPPNNLPPRERKAGCKNFYWKGFTSC